jgi:hypothetical protein
VENCVRTLLSCLCVLHAPRGQREQRALLPLPLPSNPLPHTHNPSQTRWEHARERTREVWGGGVGGARRVRFGELAQRNELLEMRDAPGARQIWPRTVSTALGTFGIDPTA